MIAVVQPPSALGLTQASNVMPVVRSSELLSATVTQLLVPLKDRAPPNLPADVHVALERVPLLLLPELSAAAVPVPSLKPRASTRPFGAALDTVTVTPPEVDWLPAASRARAVIVCAPLVAPVVFHEREYGVVRSSAPRTTPSNKNCTPTTPTLSAALADSVTVP